MSFATGTPCPDLPQSRTEEWRLQRAQYGDGYEQRALDGINALSKKWKLSFSYREKAALDPLLAELRNAGAGALTFKDPDDGVLYQVVCSEWSVDWQIKRAGLLYGTLDVEFEKFNGLALGGGAP